MTDHIKRKHKIQEIGSKTKFNELLDDMVLSESEKEFMKMFYLDKKDIGYIADTLGYSRQGILRMHKRILKRVEALL